MLKYLVRGILSAVAIKMVNNYRHLSLQLLKIEAAKSYLHGVDMARLLAVGLMRMGLVIALICVGVLLFHAGLFILLPWTTDAKALFAILLGSGYVAIGCVALHAAMGEKTWMEKSGASQMLEDATGQCKKD